MRRRVLAVGISLLTLGAAAAQQEGGSIGKVITVGEDRYAPLIPRDQTPLEPLPQWVCIPA